MALKIVHYFGGMATLSSKSVLDCLNDSFQPTTASDSDNEGASLGDLNNGSLSVSSKDFEESNSSDEEPPSLTTPTSTKKQKLTGDKGVESLAGITPKRAKGKQVRPKQLAHSKDGSKSIRKTKCTVFDFDSDPLLDVTDDTESTTVLSVLKDISTTLNTLMGRVENTEKEIKSVKSKLTHASSPSSSSDSSRSAKPDVPNIIRVSVYSYYKYNVRFFFYTNAVRNPQSVQNTPR